jgi:hypothetical protein
MAFGTMAALTLIASAGWGAESNRGRELSACALSADESRLIGKSVTLRALLTDASPHGVYFADREHPDDWRCIIDVGRMASGKDADLWKAFRGAPGPGRQVEVIAVGTLRSEVREDGFGKRSLTYFLDRMTLRARVNGR